MHKSMARIDGNGTVINMEWCSISQPETDTLKDPGDRSVGIGDTYLDGHWYRDGVEILTQYEEAMKKIATYETALTTLGVNVNDGT